MKAGNGLGESKKDSCVSGRYSTETMMQGELHQGGYLPFLAPASFQSSAWMARAMVAMTYTFVTSFTGVI